MSRFMGASKGIGVGFGGGGPLISLGGAFWQAYFDADQSMTLSGSDVATWTSLVGSHVLTPGAVAPSLGTIGALRAVVFDKANTETLYGHSLASVFSGDDTPFSVFAHVKFTTITSQDTLLHVSSSVSSLYYLWLRALNTNSIVTAGRAGGIAANGDAAALLNTDECIVGWIRYGDTYDISINGTRVVTGGNLALASLGALNRFSIGCRIVAGAESTHGDFALRRLAIASGSGITNAQIVALDAAWRGR